MSLHTNTQFQRFYQVGKEAAETGDLSSEGSLSQELTNLANDAEKSIVKEGISEALASQLIELQSSARYYSRLLDKVSGNPKIQSAIDTIVETSTRERDSLKRLLEQNN